MLSHCAYNRPQQGAALETGGPSQLCSDVQGTRHRGGHRDVHARAGNRHAGGKTGGWKLNLDNPVLFGFFSKLTKIIALVSGIFMVLHHIL